MTTRSSLQCQTPKTRYYILYLL